MEERVRKVIKIDAIKVEDRQRKEIGDVTELAKSILDQGLIHPPVVDGSNRLLAGGRRLEAMKLLDRADICDRCGHFQEGWFDRCPKCDGGDKATHLHYYEIPVDVIHIRDEYHRVAVEAEENIKRKALTPAERDTAIALMHDMYQKTFGKAVKGHAGEGWGQKDTAKAIGVSVGTVNQARQTARLLQIDPTLADAETTAEIWARFKQKRMKLIRAEILVRLEAEKEVWAEEVDPSDYIKQGDGALYLYNCLPQSVDLIIADVPYGIDVEKSISLKTSGLQDLFDDSKNAALAFLKPLILSMHYALKDNSHAFIFCSWELSFVVKILAQQAGFFMETPPWIWSKIHQTPSVQPKLSAGKCYEPICHLRKGMPDCEIDIGKDVIAVPKISKPAYPTEKPVDLTEQLVLIGSDPGATVVDPCCGRGGTVVAALKNGRRGVGVDISEEAVKLARLHVMEYLKEAFDAGDHEDTPHGEEEGSD